MEKGTKETAKKDAKKTETKGTNKEPKEPKEPKGSKNPKNPNQKDVKTSEHAARYVVIGMIITVFNYLVYTLLSNVIINNNDLLWLSTLISTTITTLLAFLLHSKITWKERPITKTAKYKFFIWNLAGAFVIGPLLTQLFSLFTPIYEFAYQIIEALHIPFSYEFTLTTGVFVLTSAVYMILNFFLYDKFVFGKSKKQQMEEKK